MRTPYRFLTLAFLMVVVGCAALGIQQPKSIEERLAYAYASHTAVLQATTSSLNVGAITSADAERILSESDTARTALDAAQVAIGAGDVSTAEGRLAAAVAILTQLQAYLHSKSARG
jgi:hypothetical protein